MLKRKIDEFLLKRKNNPNKKPLLISGARQIGKTTSIQEFGKKEYKSYIEIDFIKEPSMVNIFKNGYDVDSIINLISFYKPNSKFIPKKTLIFFDEIQEIPDALTCFKYFGIDKRFDLIASGSMLGVNYKKIKSIPVGYREEYTMYSLDFEEYLWANGYGGDLVSYLYNSMKRLIPINDGYLYQLRKLFNEYIFIGGMPEVINEFLKNKLFGVPFEIQKRIYNDYEDDITKYVSGLDVAKVKNIYRHISSQLAKDNHKFQISQIKHGARFREYGGCEERLKDAGIINIAYNLNALKKPFSSYEMSNYFRIYFAEHSLFIATLDEEAKEDLKINQNFNIYNGALYESLVSEALIKAGYNLYFYKTDDSETELDFVIRVKNEIVPIEVKRTRGRSTSLNNIIEKNPNVSYGVKLMDGNIGYSNNIFTFPYFLTFLLKKFFKETNIIKW